jgi:hypothetical protein
VAGREATAERLVKSLSAGATVADRLAVPTGQYHDTRLFGLGTNRWFFRPEL